MFLLTNNYLYLAYYWYFNQWIFTIQKIFFLIDNGLPTEGIYADFSDDKNINEIEQFELDYLIKLSSEMINLLSQKKDFDKDRAKMSLRTDEPFKTYWEFIEEKIWEISQEIFIRWHWKMSY